MQGKKGNSVTEFFKGVYNNEYQWSLVKSIAIFAIGVRVAQECVGLELMPSIAAAPL